ncbi:hypothetical protein INT80_05165 [Gallibacterium anatis]|uniref:Uncharacterized protein n=1 Tax=Gallibacterium anatis TaxID=750 RepID=A0A930USI3_9PAST|nr:hypothetical protein [Gallibacterium anatis]
MGAYSLALGNSSLAFGYDASAGALDAINIYKNSDDGYGSGWTTNQAFSELQKDFLKYMVHMTKIKTMTNGIKQ